MRIAIITDSYPPMKSSAAVQMHDLAIEFSNQGHMPLVILPDENIKTKWKLDEEWGVNILRIRAFKTKDVGYIRRVLVEFLMPFILLRGLRHSPFKEIKWEGLVWYSPSIFNGPLIRSLKQNSQCKSYLILRDIFPEWAVDMGIISRGVAYRFFKMVERFQYSVADTIGVQTYANLTYFKNLTYRLQGNIEVLQNWSGLKRNIECRIKIADTHLSGKKILVYAGNMGVAQGMGRIFDLVRRFQGREDVGFIFVGRGSEVTILKQDALRCGLTNVVFFNEIHPDEIVGLYSQCHIGIVALDPRHSTHNIPGKFISYMQAGLPTLANVNLGNDLIKLIKI